jgi:hypothetical protein
LTTRVFLCTSEPNAPLGREAAATPHA